MLIFCLDNSIQCCRVCESLTWGLVLQLSVLVVFLRSFSAVSIILKCAGSKIMPAVLAEISAAAAACCFVNFELIQASTDVLSTPFDKTHSSKFFY